MANVRQAPNMFQSQDPDLAAQQLDVQRKQQLAEMLRKQSMEPIDGQQMVTGAGPARAVRISPWQSAAKVAQAVTGAYLQAKGDEKAPAINAEIQRKRIEALRGLAPAGVFDDQGANAELSDAPQASTPGNQVDPAMRQAWVRALNVAQTNPELGGKLIENLSTLTPEQKDMYAQGLDPKSFGAARMKKMAADGTINVAPNNTVLDADTKEPIFAAPDFKSGITNSFGADGAPQVSRMAGSDVISQMAGEIKGAEAGAQAGYDMVSVNTEDGPKMMTRAQAAQLSSGKQQVQPQKVPPQGAQGFPQGTQMPAPTPGMQSRQEILQAELQVILARPDSDPRKAGDLAAIQREIGGARAVPGIPLQTEAQREQQIGAVRTAQEVEKSRLIGAQAPEQLQKMTDANSVVSLIDMAAPLLDSATGSGIGAIRDRLGNIVGKSSKASESAAQLAAIGGALVSKMPKMSGPQSDKDVLLYKEMAGQIGDPNIPSGQKRAAMQVVRMINAKYASENQGSVADNVLKANKNSGAVRRYNPATGRIE